MMYAAPAWAAHYIGVPFRVGGRDLNGVDCYGLVRLIYQLERQIVLPEVDTPYHETGPHVAPMVQRGTLAGPWEVVADREQPFDVLVINEGGEPCHLGLVLAPGWMLHAARGQGVGVSPHCSPRYRNRIAYRVRYNAASAAAAGACCANAVPAG